MIEAGIEGPLTATLGGRLVTLEPFAEEHRDGLWEAAQADEIWTGLAHLNKSREFFDYWFDLTLASDARGEESLARPEPSSCAAPPTAWWSARVATSGCAATTAWSRSAGPGSTLRCGGPVSMSRRNC